MQEWIGSDSYDIRVHLSAEHRHYSKLMKCIALDRWIFQIYWRKHVYKPKNINLKILLRTCYIEHTVFENKILTHTWISFLSERRTEYTYDAEFMRVLFRGRRRATGDVWISPARYAS